MRKVLFIANRDFVLYNFRFELIEKLIGMGNQVYISLPYGPKVDMMVQAGAIYLPLSVDGRGLNVLRDFLMIHKLKGMIKSISPDVVLLYTTKIDIYGGMVARRMSVPYVINISGLGTVVGGKGLLQRLLISMYKDAVKDARCVFFQNRSNQEFFNDKKIKYKNGRLIPGSGVNLQHWKYMEYPSEESGIHFLFIARIIKEKGIDDYLDVASKIKEENDDVFFHVIGPCDGNYMGKLQKYEEEGIIKYHGMVDDTRVFLKDAHCLIHPSYYPEGISNVCLEAAACGRPIITTDNPGCREIVDDHDTGFVVQSRNKDELIKKVKMFLALSGDERKMMGIKARTKMQNEFDRNQVIDSYLEVINMVTD